MKKTFVFVALSLLFVSCVHKTPFQEEYYFQAMGDSSEVVITADVGKIKESTLEILPKDNMIIDRTDRISVGLLPETTEVYPLPIESYGINGALEGNFGKIVTNTALAWSGEFDKEKEDGVKYYSNGSIEVGSPKSGLVLFSDTSYTDHYSRTYLNREKLISDDIALEMASSAAGLYLNTPETLVDIGFELPDTAIKKIERCYFLIDEVDGQLYMNGKLVMWEDGDAKTMNTLLRNQLLVSLRKSGVKFNVKDLAAYFTYEGNIVSINDFALQGDMAAKAQTLITDAVGSML